MADSESVRQPDVSGPSSVPAAEIAATAAPLKKARSPVERAIVWGGICVLLIVVAIEFKAAYALASDRDAVLAAIDQSLKPVTETQVEKLVTRYSRRDSETRLMANELAASRVDTYRYGGLVKSRILYVYYGLPRKGHEQEVLQVGEIPIRFYTPEDFGLGPDGKPKASADKPKKAAQAPTVKSAEADEAPPAANDKNVTEERAQEAAK